MSTTNRWTLGLLGASLALGGTTAGLNAQMPASPPALGIDTTQLDRGVRPQDDFFRYVNGSWLKSVRIPEDRSRYGAFEELAERTDQALLAIIEEATAARRAEPGSDEQKVGDLYRSFMDTARVEALGVEPLRPELRRIQALGSRKELPAHFARLRRMGVGLPFGFYVGQDAKQSDRYIAYLSQSGLGLPDRDYYLKQDDKFEQARQAYLRYAETMLRLAGHRNPAEAARQILALETALAERHWERARSRDREATYNLFSVEQLAREHPNLGWRTFLDAADAEQTPGVVVRQPDYLRALDQLIATTPLDTWKAYLTLSLLDTYAGQLSRPFADARFDFSGRALQGLEEQRPRWKRGVDQVEAVLGMPLGRMYVRRHFRPEAKARMERLVDNLRVAFREGIDGLEWMGPETRAQAKDKLAKFTVKIGYPDRWPDYSGLEVRADDLVGNVMRSRAFEYGRMVGRLGQPIDREEWGMTPQTVNAYYSPSKNEIVFPAAILQPPFFDVEADDAVNYGAIGGVIGHEISHGFDDQGRRSDGEGNLRDWWTETDARAFEQRADMLVEQYAGYEPVEGLPINGRLTLGENIGDLSGLAVAYQAYRRSLDGAEAPIIGGFTGDQRFFMGWAQIWRNLYREEALRQRLLTDSHSPGEYRVNGVLVNLPEFYAAFGVEPGDRMYLAPEKRVKIW
jgi:putative endopeptidase